MTLGAFLSTSQLKFVEQNFGDVVEVKTYKASEHVQLDIEGGRLDVQFDNVVFARDRADASKGTLVTSGPLLVAVFRQPMCALECARESSSFKPFSTRALGQMAKDGTLAARRADLQSSIRSASLSPTPAYARGCIFSPLRLAPFSQT